MLCLLLFPLPEGKQRQSINYSVFLQRGFQSQTLWGDGFWNNTSLNALRV